MASWQAWKNRFCTALFLGALSAHAAAADPVLSLSPATVQGSTVSLDVLISGISDLYAYQYSLSFDPTLLQVANVSEGAFLASGGSTFFDGGSFDNTAGSISFTFDSLIGPIAGVSGSGALAHISFNAVAIGSSALTFSDVLFLNSSLADISVLAQNGVVQAVPEPTTMLLFGAGLAGLGALRRRQSTAAA